jgi:uncharacterized damage-inducible protein DinB
MRTLTLLMCLLATATVASSQEPPKAEPSKAVVTTHQRNPFSVRNRQLYQGEKKILLGAAEKMPEQNYNFKPTEAVRSFGQIVGHIAESQYFFCSNVLDETNPAPKIEQTKTSKADLIAALKDAFAYCDKAYDGMTDASAAEMVKFMGDEQPKLGVLTTNHIHTMLHYGNLITYMRLKNIVPPTSDPEFMHELMKK